MIAGQRTAAILNGRQCEKCDKKIPRYGVGDGNGHPTGLRYHAAMNTAAGRRTSFRNALFLCAILASLAATSYVGYRRFAAQKHVEKPPPPNAPGSATAADLASTAPVAPRLPGVWTLKFEDEFSGPTLRDIWTPHQYWDTGATVGEGDEESDPANVQVSDGSLRLTAQNERKFGKTYTGALVQTGGIRGRTGRTFSFLYGYAEARIRIPAGQGLWPAFWLMPASYNDTNGEIDIVDNGTGNPNVLHGTAIVHGRKDQHQHPQELSGGFHTFAVDWQADHITWYVDGKPWTRTTDRSLICAEAMYPIFDLAVGGDWGGPPNTSTRFPAVMEVDWIRVWQKS
jgi:beta-glucanase (GH16 family)